MTEHIPPTTPPEDASSKNQTPPAAAAGNGSTTVKPSLEKPVGHSGGSGASGSAAAAKSADKTSVSLILAVAAIILAILLAGWLYLSLGRQVKQQAVANSELQASLDSLNQSLQQQQQQSSSSFDEQGKALDSARRQQDAQQRQLSELQDKVATISGTDAKTWLLAQADFLVKMAGRKLWSDQDIVTAAALLKSADASLADMNDPSLMNVRRAITEDVGDLSSVAQVDFDGIILKVNLLSNQVDNLRLADSNNDDSPMDSDSSELSASVREWRQNLSKSWHNFMNDFITIRRRDSHAEPLLAPNQDIYLRENIRSRLLVAAQAVPRHQNEVYQQSLETISTWVRAYFDPDDATTRAFLADVDELSQQSISLDVPDQLRSQPLLEKLMQTRVRNLLSQQPQPAEPVTPSQQPSPSQQPPQPAAANQGE
ncbi:uroporphyrin-3 C-methyltransferase [Biostraticola tofi]|uniref:Uroporphyrin-3 C-methyltransferase n=1 Tax=Biostraticola tofi TaxID=466109 RepID=A0A4R3YR44_9GAMM|nr:uroporphyrinogen-III C-methyltransferase [Biostraticola tofi]TCV93714.1 uroporphyrin-3 C-methyltransferase [Biostraticola tofi]